MVGYNRRFCRTAQAARAEVRNGSPLIAQLVLPEDVRRPNGAGGSYLLPFFGNSVHGLDLARFVFGDLEVVDVLRLSDHDAPYAVAALLCSPRGDVVKFVGNWRTPANFSLTLGRPGRRFEMRPFEFAHTYERMGVVEPTPERPIRRYVPEIAASLDLDEVDRRFKPGFVQQAHAFAGLISGEVHPDAARIEDAHAVLELAERLAGRTCS